MQRFINELQRRGVHRAAILYAGAAWLLMQIASQIFPFFEIPNWAVRAVVIGLLVGFPFAMLFSWYFEWTLQGVRREQERAEGTPAPRPGGAAIDRWIIVVLGLVVAGLLLNQFVLHRFAPRAEVAADPAGDRSIAVLPFANTSGDPANEYFSDGLSEELIGALGRLQHLRVIGRSSSFQYKGRTEDSRAIGGKLGVIYLLEGSVRKSSDRVRIAVELVKAADGAALWTESYDRRLDDIFAVQSEIAGAVAAQLKIALLGDAATSTSAPSNRNVEAYNALLQGNHFFERRTVEDLRTAIGYYEDAIRRDPGYAMAWARLSSTQTLLATTIALKAEEIQGTLARARVAADTALRLEPGLGEAHYARAILLQNGDFDWAAAEAEFRRASELVPRDPSNLLALGFRKSAVGRFDESLAIYRRMIAIDPLFSGGLIYYARALIAAGAYDEAEAELRKSVELQPQGSQAYLQLAVLQILRGDAASAVELARRETNPFWRNYGLALAYFAHGDRQQADAQLKQLIDENADSGGGQIAAVYALRKEPDRVFEWLERARVTHDSGAFLVRVDPFLSAYRKDPRYEAFCRTIGLPGPDRSR